MNKILLLVLVLLSLGFVRAQAQGVQVDPLTGRAMVSLPIWNVKSGDVSASISLSYTAGNGMKLNDGQGTAGMNWSISSFAIEREVRGLPDDLVGAASGVTNDTRNGWLHQNTCRQAGNFVPSADQNFSVCTDEIADWNTLNGFGYVNDTEPDLFSFHAPGLSGQFMFDNNKTMRPIPYQDLKIVTYRQGADSLINQIEITNNLGVKYTFQAGDKTGRHTSPRIAASNVTSFTSLYNYYNIPGGITYFYSSWYLTQITSPAGGNITLTYGSATDAVDSQAIQVVNNSINAVDTLYFVTDHINFKQLQSITGSNEKLTFSWNAEVIGSISVTDLTYSTSIKKFDFVYMTVGSPRNPVISGYTDRQFLTQMKEEVNCYAYPGYKFDYYGLTAYSLPFNSGIGQDIFGYYNGTATSAVPEVYVTTGDTGADGERYRIVSASGYSLIASGGGRSVNPATVYYGALKSITVPSGGQTTITYEPNVYFDAGTNSNITGGGVRVNSINTTAGDPGSDVTTSYKYRISTSSSQSSGAWVYRPMFAFANGTDVTRVPNNLAPDETILYSRTEVSTLGKGKVVYEFLTPGVYPQNVTNDFTATLTRLARPDPQGGSCANLGNLRSGYYTFPNTLNTNYDFERGLPSQITDYTFDWKPVRRKIYAYQRTTLPVTTISGVHFEKFGTTFQYGKYSLLSNVDETTLTETTRVFDQANNGSYVESATNYTYNGNQMVGKIASTNSDNTTYNRTFQYAKDYALTGSDVQSQMISALVNNNAHGTVIETVTSNGSNVTGAQLTLFNNFGNGRVLPSQQLALGDPTGFTASSVSGANFVYSGNYYPVMYVDAYDNLGHATILRDQSRMTRSSIMGYNSSLAAADLTNARYDQVVFADFEPTPSTTVTTTGVLNTSDNWSGKNSLTLNTGNTFQQSTVARGVGQYYRFSCWVKAGTAATLTIQINGVTTATVSYPTAANPTLSTWQYLEKQIDMSSITGNFSFSLSSSANVIVDNVAFYPQVARIAFHAYDPLNGKTSDIDSKGVSGFQEYDQLGRVHYLKNQDKDIVQIKDYHYKTPFGVTPVSQFSGNFFPAAGTPATYGALPSCVDNVSYAWYVDDVNQNVSSSSFTYTFNQNRNYRVKLVATSANYGSSTTESVIKPTPTIQVTVSLAAGESNTVIVVSDPTGVRDFSVSVTGSYDAGTLWSVWEVSTDGVYWQAAAPYLPDPTKPWPWEPTLTYGRNDKTFYIRCRVGGTSKNGTTNNNDWVTGTSNSIQITVVPCTHGC